MHYSSPSTAALSPGSKPASWTGRAALIVALVAVGFVGILVPLLPAGLVFGLVLAPLFLYAGAVWPIPALLVSLFILFQTNPDGWLPRIGSVRTDEFLFAYIVAMAAARTLMRGEPLFKRLAEFRWPLLFLVCCLVASLVYVRFYAPNEFYLSQLRSFVPWFTLPLLMVIVRDQDDFRLLVRGVLAVGLAYSVIVILQSTLDIRILADARVEALDKESNSDVTRSIAGGVTYLMSFGLIYFLNLIARKHARPAWLMLGCLVFAGGLAVSFGRGVWIATAAGLMLATFLDRGIKGVVQVAILGSLILAFTLSLGWVVKPRLVEAMVERAVGVGEEVESGGSFGWRRLENQAAKAALEAHPWTGVGIGGEYKKSISGEGSFQGETWYIHNAYLGYAVKLGLHAALYPPWMVLCFALAVRRTLRASGRDSRALISACAGAFAAPVITSYTQPEWMDEQGVAAFCLFIGMVLLSRFVLERDAAPAAEPVPAPLPGSGRPRGGFR